MNFLEQAEKIISMNSVSQNGNEEVAVFLQGMMNKNGMKAHLQEVTHSLEGVSKRQFNVIGILGDPLVDRTTKKGLLLNTHIDTVGPGVASYWTETGGHPFKATIKNGKIFGLGSADVKLDFLCKLKAVEKYRNRKLKMPIYLVGTAGEEIGMLGAKYLIKSQSLNPKYIIVGEPSELSVIYAHKAYVVYQISISYNLLEKDAKGFNTRIQLVCLGKSAHGSYPHLGDNAIHKTFAMIQKIKEANFQIKLSKFSGGDSVNKVPDTASVEFFLTSGNFEDFKKFHAEKLNAPDVRVDFGGLGEAGMKFMPENIFEAASEIRQCFMMFEKEFEGNRDESFNPATSTVNFGKMTSKLGNMDLFFDVRLLPEIGLEAFDDRLKTAIGQINARFPNLNIKIQRNRFNPALGMSKDSELVKAACEAQKNSGIEVKLDKKATSTEAAQYYAAGYDSIVFGPGRSHGNSHSPNEFNFVDHLDKAIHFYDRMIERFCI